MDEKKAAAFRPGVGIMLLNRRGQVFVGHRIDIPGDTWQMPQGGIEPGEAPRDAALRELREEIGTDAVEILTESNEWLRYELPAELHGKAWQGRWRGQRQKWFVMRFLGQDDEINIATETPEFDTYKWVSIRQLPELVISFKRQVYSDLLTEFSHLSGEPVAALLADPMIRMAMAADGVDEDKLLALLRETAARLGDPTAKAAPDPWPTQAKPSK